MSRTANYDCQYSGSWKADVQVVCTVHKAHCTFYKACKCTRRGKKYLWI